MGVEDLIMLTDGVGMVILCLELGPLRGRSLFDGED